MARPVQVGKGSKFIILASVCVVVAALYFAREVLVPLALAILLTFLLAPLVRRVERLGLGRVPATLVVVLLGLGLVGVIGYVVERQFVQIADQLPVYNEQIRHKVQAFSGGGGGFGGAVKKLEKTVHDVTPVAPRPAPTAPATQPATQPTTGPATQPAVAGTENPAAAAVPPLAPITPPPPQPSDAAPGVPTLPHVTPENPLPVRTYPEQPSAVKQIFE